MENIYIAYTRKVNNQTMYFVKRFTRFTDIPEMPNVLSDYGMHSSFKIACSIARISDPETIRQLALQAGVPLATEKAKVIAFNAAKQAGNSFLKNTQNFLSRLRLAGLTSH